MTEKTLCIIKPDAVENDYVEKINEMISMENINIINSVKIDKMNKKFF